MKKLTLLILFGGKSTEHEVSRVSASSIIKNADREKYDLVTVGITKNGDWYLCDCPIENIRDGSWLNTNLIPAALSPSMSDHALLLFTPDGKVTKKHIDVIFPVMHGAFSEDGTMQGVLQMSGIPFVGCHCATSAIGMDKAFTKLILTNYRIPQAKYLLVRSHEISDTIDAVVADCEKFSSYPLFVKPVNAGSSVGASKAADRAALIAALNTAAEYDTKILVEEYINGKECEVAVMGSPDTGYHASTVGQIVPGSEFYDYETKYSASSTASYNIPADIQSKTAEMLRKNAEAICEYLDVDGLSRVDFFVVDEKDGGERIVFNEINTLPGFTEISMYPKLRIHDGATYAGVIDSLIALALRHTKDGNP